MKNMKLSFIPLISMLGGEEGSVERRGQWRGGVSGEEGIWVEKRPEAPELSAPYQTRLHSGEDWRPPGPQHTGKLLEQVAGGEPPPPAVASSDTTGRWPLITARCRAVTSPKPGLAHRGHQGAGAGTECTCQSPQSPSSPAGPWPSPRHLATCPCHTCLTDLCTRPGGEGWSPGGWAGWGRPLSGPALWGSSHQTPGTRHKTPVTRHLAWVCRTCNGSTSFPWRGNKSFLLLKSTQSKWK